MITYRKAKFFLIFLFSLSLANTGWCGKIVYPWNATTAIVKAGEVFTVWFDAEEGENIESIVLRGPFNSLPIPTLVQEKGSWIYDEESSFSYNTRITVTVPSTTPMEGYDLVLNTSSGEQVSRSAVKVIGEYKSAYSIFHISDTHICDESYRKADGVPRRLDWLSALVDMANIIGPELVFLTGDNVNSRSWDDGNAEYLTTWPSTQERINFYYEGSHETDRRGVYDFDAAAFSVNGNHDQYERPADGKETKNKYEFWNKYHGLRTHHFSYGDSRFMAFSDDYGEDAQVQAARHSTWLEEEGPGSLRMIYKHYYHNIPQAWAAEQNIQFGLCGHNHHKGWENPFTQGTTEMYIANFTEYSTFNLIRVDGKGNYRVENNLVALENPQDDPSQFRSNLTLEYTEANDGTSTMNTATLVNKFDLEFPEARVRFVMPKGQYTLSKGRVDQVIENDSLSVFDVRIHLDPESTTAIEISPRVQIQFKKDFAPQEGLIKNVEKPYRDEICLNGYWQFMPVKLSPGISAEEIKSQNLPSVSGWDLTPIKIPSPWNVNGFTNGEGGDFRAYPSYPSSWEDVKAGWLKKVIAVPADWSGSRIVLHFEAIAGYSKVFVNGHEAGDHFDSFLPFSLDVSEFASPGEELEILVWVAHGSLLNDPGKYGRRNYVAGSFWGIYIAGIWQDVYLQKIPVVYISDTYVKPWVDRDELEIELTLTNTTDKVQKVNLGANISRWISQNGKSVLDIPETNWTLGEECMSIDGGKLSLEPNASTKFVFRKKVDGALDLWSPGSPNLYGLIVSINGKKTTLDKDYTRFGWRQFDLKGSQLLLNGEPIVLKGDSWHFMGIPQMTRRYAYAWYQMLMDANGNAIRLHAQVFPRFYLEMADEMGICILDETAIWSSDGGPKIDSETYWEACRKHVKGLVLRDRNYPSVMGWSVCNETLPVTIYVFQAPQELIDRNIEEINQWVAIVRETDPTRSWISGDGETMADTDLPTVIGHYGGEAELERWSSQGKPWGIGETGMAYYGTPAQVAKINGDRAYESQMGRMEGLAGEAFDLISQQREHHASYSSIFNLAWYGLKPLALGLNDGIFFSEYMEAKPGYQPERLGSYSTTFNPGYDPTLPLYEAWPLFEGVKAAFSDNYKDLANPWKKVIDNTVQMEKLDEKQGMVCLAKGSKGEGKLKKALESMAILFEPLSLKQKQLIFVDGANPPAVDQKLVSTLKAAIQNGSTLLFWGADNASKSLIEALSESRLEFYERPATSYIITDQHAMLNGQSNASLYFSEMSKKPVSFYSMGGDWLTKSRILLEACPTDWQKWNYQGEAIKTAKLYRNEREAKAPGSVIVARDFGKGEILVSTIDFFTVGSQSKFLVREMITNLGGTFDGEIEDVPEALKKDGVLANVNFYGSVKNDSREIELVFDYAPLSEEEFTKVKIGSLTKGKYWDVVSADENGVFDFLQLNLNPENYAAGYMSFWLYSPRSLTDLLIEPDMPRLDMHFGADDALAFSLNGKPVQAYLRESGFVEDELSFEGLPLEKGWNHMLIKVGQGTGDWKCKVRFSSTKPAFMDEIKSVVDR